jgi:hypothetical protein
MLMMQGNNRLPILAAEINTEHEAHEPELLPKYDAACRAIAEAKSVDEVKSIRDQALDMAACAHQAGNKQLEADAAEPDITTTTKVHRKEFSKALKKAGHDLRRVKLS